MYPAPAYTTPDVGYIMCAVDEVQLPMTDEDGEQIDLVVAEVELGYDFFAYQVVVGVQAYEHEGTRYTTDTADSPYRFRHIEKLITKKVFDERRRQDLVAEGEAFADVRRLLR